jgi:hypothetical protein
MVARRLVGVGALAGAVFASGSAHAQEPRIDAPPRALDLRWSAPADCPDASYLDAESKVIDGQTKQFAHLMIRRAQTEGIIKPLDAWVLMELVFGAFIGMMKAHWEGRIQLSEQTIADAEQACWDTVALTT